ncbi:DNA glycosylase AlkZ-like family protein, partial [Paraconexibacter sp.]|uniref:DNA glycosylase AlkZ-like family protein n=1 Tax=Paraconexibacter sp. TaxID=2949640 RepID=UPI0035632414
MSRTVPQIPVSLARRMALHAQGLGPVRPTGWTAPDGTDAQRIGRVVERIGCLQLDPVSTVARSPLLVLHARLGDFDDAALGQAAYERRTLFEYWCHEASLCFAGDLPLHRDWMRRYLGRPSPRGERARAFLAENTAFARSIVRMLEREGPLPAAALEDRSARPWRHGHWTDEVSGRQTVARMLDLLWMTGKIGIADRAAPGGAR